MQIFFMPEKSFSNNEFEIYLCYYIVQLLYKLDKETLICIHIKVYLIDQVYEIIFEFILYQKKGAIV